MTDRYADIRAALDYSKQFRENCLVAFNSADIRALLAERDALREALTDMVEVAERVDSWQSFPQEPIDKARAELAQEQGGSDGNR